VREREANAGSGKREARKREARTDKREELEPLVVVKEDSGRDIRSFARDYGFSR